MPEEWMAEIVTKMYFNRISAKEIAEEAGVTSAYVSMILHGARSPKGGREMLESAINRIIERRESNERI